MATVPLVRLALQGTSAFVHTTLQLFDIHPYLVLSSGHLLVHRQAVVHLQHKLASWEGPKLLGEASVCTEPEPAPSAILVPGRTAFPLSAYVVSSTDHIAEFVLSITGLRVVFGPVEGRGNLYGLSPEPITTPARAQAFLAQVGLPALNRRLAVLAGLDSLIGEVAP